MLRLFCYHQVFDFSRACHGSDLVSSRQTKLKGLRVILTFKHCLKALKSTFYQKVFE